MCDWYVLAALNNCLIVSTYIFCCVLIVVVVFAWYWLHLYIPFQISMTNQCYYCSRCLCTCGGGVGVYATFHCLKKGKRTIIPLQLELLFKKREGETRYNRFRKSNETDAVKRKQRGEWKVWKPKIRRDWETKLLGTTSKWKMHLIDITGVLGGKSSGHKKKRETFNATVNDPKREGEWEGISNALNPNSCKHQPELRPEIH